MICATFLTKSEAKKCAIITNALIHRIFPRDRLKKEDQENGCDALVTTLSPYSGISIIHGHTEMVDGPRNRLSNRSSSNSKFKRSRVVFKNGECNVHLANISKRRRKYLADFFTTLLDLKVIRMASIICLINVIIYRKTASNLFAAGSSYVTSMKYSTLHNTFVRPLCNAKYDLFSVAVYAVGICFRISSVMDIICHNFLAHCLHARRF